MFANFPPCAVWIFQSLTVTDSVQREKGKTMSNWATIAICIILCIGMLCLIALMAVSIAESVQEMRRRKLELEREDDLIGWRRKR